jgi:hypothetical protein
MTRVRRNVDLAKAPTGTVGPTPRRLGNIYRSQRTVFASTRLGIAVSTDVVPGAPRKRRPRATGELECRSLFS